MTSDCFSQASPRMGRVRILTTVMIVITALFCIYWTTHILSWLLPFIFQNGIQSHPWVQADAAITTGQKVLYVGLWVITICIAWFSFGAAIRMLLALRSGAFFVAETWKRIQVFGLTLAAVIIADTILSAVSPAILTWHNDPVGAIGYIAPAYYFDSADIAILLCGLGFFVIGWVLAEGARIAEENEAFV